ncbi:hypothetical protein LPJ61_004276, partial [Coemansia biformis]
LPTSNRAQQHLRAVSAMAELPSDWANIIIPTEMLPSGVDFNDLLGSLMSMASGMQDSLNEMLSSYTDAGGAVSPTGYSEPTLDDTATASTLEDTEINTSDGDGGSNGSGKALKLGLGIGVPAAVLTLLCVAFYLLRRWRRRPEPIPDDPDAIEALAGIDEMPATAPPPPPPATVVPALMGRPDGVVHGQTNVVVAAVSAPAVQIAKPDDSPFDLPPLYHELPENTVQHEPKDK